ncbi:MAG TPA: lysine--tRNA ligase [Candidatus Saccharimonadia bacterium]
MATEPTSNYWLDIAAEDINKRYPEGEIVVSSGISPSASYHIGHFREVMTNEAMAWALRQRGRTVRHIHVVDNFDPLRTWYDFLPPAKQDYAGWPVALIPDPEGDCHASYADHFYSLFEISFEPMGLTGATFEIIKSYEDLYKPGHMNRYIEKALEQTPKIKTIFKQLVNRDLSEDWSPVLVLDETGRFVKGDIATWDRDAKTMNGHPYENGLAKLDWRLDWPARWVYLGVNVESFGAQEHGAAGGSYQTGAEFVKQIFGGQPPYGEVRYGHIHRLGENLKMSSSKGNVITPTDALEIMPAEVFRYFMVRSRPERKLYFDSGLGLFNLIDEFAAAQADPHHEFRDAYEFAVAGKTERVISRVSFKHLVQVYQAAQGDIEGTLQTLERTGYEAAVKVEKAIITEELKFVHNWLKKHAPEAVRFSVQQKLPEVNLNETQTAFLSQLADAVKEYEAELDGKAMHVLIYAAAEKTEIGPKDGFSALYRVILNKDYGPKAGWFLASLDRDWLVKRLKLEE